MKYTRYEVSFLKRYGPTWLAVLCFLKKLVTHFGSAFGRECACQVRTRYHEEKHDLIAQRFGGDDTWRTLIWFRELSYRTMR